MNEFYKQVESVSIEAHNFIKSMESMHKLRFADAVDVLDGEDDGLPRLVYFGKDYDGNFTVYEISGTPLTVRGIADDGADLAMPVSNLLPCDMCLLGDFIELYLDEEK